MSEDARFSDVEIVLLVFDDGVVLLLFVGILVVTLVALGVVLLLSVGRVLVMSTLDGDLLLVVVTLLVDAFSVSRVIGGGLVGIARCDKVFVLVVMLTFIVDDNEDNTVFSLWMKDWVSSKDKYLKAI